MNRKHVWCAVAGLALLIVALMALCLSCGGGGSGASSSTAPPPPAVSITISPTTASVQTGAGQQFTATVSNTTNTSVTWEVGGNVGGNSTVGTISTSGLYTAPATVPSPDAVTVTAVSDADSTKSASASVTISAAPLTVSITSPSTGAIVGGLMAVQATASAGALSVQFEINGNNLGSPVGPPFSYSLDTTKFLNGAYVLTAVATSASGATATSAALSFQIMNLGQWRMEFCSTESFVAEINFSQSGTSFSANSQNVLVFSLADTGPGCPEYPIQGAFAGALTLPVTGTISGNTNSGTFSLTFTDPDRGSATINGLCFGAGHLGTTSCVGPASGPGDLLAVSGQQMGSFSGIFTGTLSYPSGSKTVTATFTQQPNYALSVSYTDPTGTHTSSGTATGGTFTLIQGFDGNPAYGTEQCTGPVEAGFATCTTIMIYVFDSNWNYLGTLQPTA